MSVSRSNIVGIVLFSVLAYFVVTTPLGAHPDAVLALCVGCFFVAMGS